MSKRARKYVSIREYWAAALSMLLPQAQRDELRARKAPAKSVIALFHQDHNILHAFGGPDRWWNLTPMLREAHIEKTKRDIAIVHKSRRILRKFAEPTPDPLSLLPKPRAKARIPSRPMGNHRRDGWTKSNKASKLPLPPRRTAE